ncbi:MAG: hypothetical protein Q9218_006526, partial [Villophora microphyllina]
ANDALASSGLQEQLKILRYNVEMNMTAGSTHDNSNTDALNQFFLDGPKSELTGLPDGLTDEGILKGANGTDSLTSDSTSPDATMTGLPKSTPISGAEDTNSAMGDVANAAKAKAAGAFAAFTVDFLVYPLDTIKTRIQSPDYRRLFTTDGVINRSLFRADLILAGAFFTTYEATKTSLHTLNASLPSPSSSKPLIPIPILHALASSTGELVSCLILTPAEVLKQNAQVVVRKPSPSSSTTTSASPSSKPQPQPQAKPGAFDTRATRLAYNKFRNNPSHLWRGYTALVARNLPFTAMQFPLFESLRTRIYTHRQRNGTRSGTLLETGIVTALSAGSAGSLAAVVTTPIDVVKTRIMLGAGDDSSSRPQKERVMKDIQAQGRDAKAEIERMQQAARGGRAGGWAVGKEVLRTEGMRGLFRGGALRGAWTALGSGLYLGVYESGRKGLERRRLGQYEGVGVV